MRPGGGQRDLLGHLEQLAALHAEFVFGLLVFVFVVLVVLASGIARIRFAHALRQRRVVEPRLARLARLELDRGQRFDFDHRARRAPRRPVGLIEQRGIDEQRVAAPDPLVERAEFVAVKHLHRGQREDQQVAARRNVEIRQRAVTLAQRTHFHAGTLQPFVQPRVTIAATLGAWSAARCSASGSSDGAGRSQSP